MASLIYDAALYAALTGAIDFDDDSFRAMLVGASYAPDAAAHAYRSDVSGEVTGSGYSAGGAEVAVTAEQQEGAVEVSLGGALWGPASITARGAVYYKSRGGAASADELVAYIDFGENVSATNGNFTLDRSLLRILSGDAEEADTMIQTVVGTDGGHAYVQQTRGGPGAKEVVVALVGYLNTTGTPQTVTFSVPFLYDPVIFPNSDPACSASTTTLTLPASMADPVDAVVVIKGF